MGKGKSTSTSVSQPWKPAQPYLTQGMGWLNDLYKSGGMTTDYSGDWVADMTPEQLDAIKGISGTAGSNNEMLGQAAGGLLGLATGQTQAGDWDRIATDTIQKIMPGINSSFAGSGMTGSTLHQQNLSQGLSQGLGMAANDFQRQSVEQQLGATGALGGVLGQIMGNQEAALGAQDRIQQQEQNELDSQYQNSLLGQNADFDALSNYLSVISGIAGLGGQGTATQQQKPGMMGILSGIAGLGSMFSDRRLKEDVKRVGQTDDGVPIFTYRYKGSDQVHMGVMAQDVAQVRPDAVSERHGYLAVDYGAI